jgi:hypothetical protein
MKKFSATINLIIMAIFCVIIFSSQSNAQDKPLNFGVKVGISSSVFTRDFQAVSERLTGFSGGGFVTYKITNFFSVGAELLYIQQGASNIMLIDTLPNTSTNLTFHTIDLPVLLFFHVPDMNGISPKFFIGHAFGYNVKVYGRNRTQINNDPVMYVRGTHDLTNRYERLDFGGIAGVGVDFKTSKMLFSVDARYRLGYLNMFSDDFNQTSFGFVSLNVGVGF